MDTQYKLLDPVTTCRNLIVGHGSVGAFYPRCSLGNEQDRRRWVDEVGTERLAAIKEMSMDYRAWVAELMPNVWQRKAEVLSARASGRGDGEQMAYLRASIADLVASAGAWIDERAERLTDVGLDPALLKQLVKEATEEWALRPEAQAQGYQVPDEVLARFPEPVQVFIRSGRTAS